MTPWTALLSIGFLRQEYWSGLSFSSPGDLTNPGIGPVSPALQADSLPLSHQGSSPNHWTPREVPRVVRFEGTNASLQDRNTEYSKSLKISLAYSIRSVGDSKVHLKDGDHWVEGFLLGLGIIQYKLGDFQVQKEKRKSYSYIECSL